MASFKLYLFGSPHIECETQPIQIPRRRAMALLAYLAVTGRRHSREALAAFLWPEYDHHSGRTDLSRTLSLLRKRTSPELFNIDRETAGLNPEAGLWVDVLHYEKLLREAAQHGHDQEERCSACLAQLVEAVALYQADFLDGFTLPNSRAFDEWQFYQSDASRQALLGALERLSEAYEAQGNWTEALKHARRWVELDPLHEGARRRLMMLYANRGQHTTALRQYQLLVEYLQQELQVAPQPETTALYERIRQNRERQTEGNGKSGHSPAAPSGPRFLEEGPEYVNGVRPLFVGRERELLRLEHDLESALQGDGRVAFITGEAGRGKSSLMAEFASRAQEEYPDLLVANSVAHAFSGIGDPYLLFRDVLAALSGDADRRWASGLLSREQARRLWSAVPTTVQALLAEGPELLDVFVRSERLLERVRAQAPAEAEWLLELQELLERKRQERDKLATGQLFEQVTQTLRAIAAQRPLLLLLDDLQWADSASVGLLFHMARHLTASRIFILGAYRMSEVAFGRALERSHPLKPVVNELVRHFGDIIIDLSRLSRAENRGFVDAYLDATPNRLSQNFREAFYQQTEGHPLFAGELLREMRERGDLVHDSAGLLVEGAHLDWTKLPVRVEAVIERRLERLPPDLHDLLVSASVQGDTFTAEVVAAVQGWKPRAILRRLSGQLRDDYGLVREQGSLQVGERYLSRYQFSHTLFRQYIYERLTQTERRLLHGQIARVLEELYEAHTDDISGQLAHHFTEAGERHKATDYLLQAGDRARDRYAHQEAIDLYQQALGFLKELGQYERAARALMKLGQTHHQIFDFQQARQAYEEGFALWQQVGKRRPSFSGQASGETLRIHWSSPRSFDPTRVNDSESEAIMDQLFSGLLEQNADLDVVPGIAQSWEVLDDGRRYRFHLREDVRWSDGVQVTAHDFACAWRRFLDPQQGSSLVSQLYGIKGARDFHEGRLQDWEQVGVTVVDDTTLVVDMEKPTNYFAHLMTLSYGYPIPQHVVEAHGEQWTDVQHIVTNGPFRLEGWRPDEIILLARNPHYYGSFGGNLKRVEVYLSPDGSSLPARMYANGDLDVLTFFSHRKLPAADLELLQRQFADDAMTTPWLLTIYLGFVTDHPPFDDPRVRQALAMAVNKEIYAHEIRSGSESPAMGGFIPPGVPGHAPGIGLPYDPETASRLLAAAGYGGGRGFPTIRAVTGPHRADAASHLQAQWREHLGVDIAWEITDRRVSLAQVNQGQTDLYIVGWIADYPDPANYLARNHHALQQLKWQDPAFLTLLDRAERTFEQANRLALYEQADRMMIEAAAMMPLVYGQNKTFIKKRVSHYPISSFKFWYWKDVVIGELSESDAGRA